jgi:hypothetical protein
MIIDCVFSGRNVALKEKTSQSSTYNETSLRTNWQEVFFVSNRAVDGDTSGNFYSSNSCASTMGENRKTGVATFNVTFARPRMVNRYVIYIRNRKYRKP